MPESDARFTIRPPPARTIGPRAARQHRKVPVRLIRSVSSQIWGIVASRGTLCSTAAAQTNAVGAPRRSATANSRSTSRPSPTSVTATVAKPPALRIASPASSSCVEVRAASTTWAPARAIASAVARPIPRPAPVTIATRPCNHPGVSAMRVHPGLSLESLVKVLVRCKARIEIQVEHSMPPAVLAPDAADRPERPGRAGDIVRLHQKTGPPVDDDLRQSATAVGDHRGAGRLRLGGDHAKRLLPLRRAQHRARTGQHLPQLRTDQSAVDRNACLSPV